MPPHRYLHKRRIERATALLPRPLGQRLEDDPGSTRMKQTATKGAERPSALTDARVASH